MQRPATRQSRAANAEEKRHISWIKQRGMCAACGNDGGVIAHHMHGSSAKVRVGLEVVLIGHWAVLGLCQCCDDIVTRQSRRAFRESFGQEEEIWENQSRDYPGEIPEIIRQGIMEYGK